MVTNSATEKELRELRTQVEELRRQLAEAHAELSELHSRDVAAVMAQLEAEKTRWQATVESMLDPVTVADAAGRAIYMNAAYSQMIGRTIPESLEVDQHPDYFKIYHPDGTLFMPDELPLQKAALKGVKSRNVELVHLDPAGGAHTTIVSAAPLRDANGQLTGAVAVGRDITLQRQAELEKEKLLVELRQAHDELELRVRQRTDELAKANQDLLAIGTAERRQRRLAETMSGAALVLSESLNLDTVLKTLLDYTCKLVPFDCANVMLLEAEDRLEICMSRGYEPWASQTQRTEKSLCIDDSPVLRELFDGNKTVIVADTALVPIWETLPGCPSVRSWLGVPLVVGGKVIGICALEKTVPCFFTSEHAHLAELMVHQAAVALQNAWLFEQVRAGRQRLQSLSRRLVEVQEAERRYVASELHDDAGQSLTSLLFSLGQLEQETDPLRRSADIAELKKMADKVMEDLHALAMDLRPASLDHLGLVPAVRQYVQMIEERYHLLAQFMARGFETERLKQEIETALFRIVQEALTNVVRHASATLIDVLLERRSDRVILIVEDNGIGFEINTENTAKNNRLGLAGMQERAEMLGGTLVVESRAGKGTTIVAEIPLPPHLDGS